MAAAIEALSLISPPVEARSLRQSVAATAMAEARARDCLDWTERKPHLAGALPAALLARFLELGWLDRRRNDRGLTITDLGRAHLPALGLAAPALLEPAAR